MKDMPWSFAPVKPATVRKPADNTDTVLLVEPRQYGGWQLRFAGDAPEEAFGNYPSSDAAYKAASANCTNVQVRPAEQIPVGIAAIPTLSPDARFAAVCNHAINTVRSSS